MDRLAQHTLDGKTYIDVKQLMPLRPYAKGCNSMARLIQRKGLRDVINGRIVDGVLTQTEKQSCRHGSKYVCKDEIMELFDESTIEIVEYPPAPPVLADDDLVFFKDEDGVEHDVLMRGSRTREGIYFKVKDVERVFQMKEITDMLQRADTVYVGGQHYQWFTPSIPEIHRNQQGRELYLTYSGLKHMIEASRSGVGYKFKQWLDEIVFAAAFGTVDQKAKAFARTFDTDIDHLKAIMKKTSNDISCLYLIDIKETKDGRRIYKYGYTKHLRTRQSQHLAKYGKDIELVQWVFVPESLLSNAEKRLKDITLPYSHEKEGENELIALDDKEYNSVIAAYQSISRDYSGNLTELTSKYESQIKDKDVEILVAKHETQLIRKDLEIGQRDLKIAQMQIQLLEEKLKSAGL